MIIHFNKFRTILVLCLVTVTNLVSLSEAQEQPSLHFTHIESRHGLSQNAINVVRQDTQGYIWIGTDNGLNRFDGYEIEQYLPEYGVPNTIKGSKIKAIAPANDERIWIGSLDGGLSVYNTRTEQFHNVDLSTALATQKSIYVRAIHMASDSSLWLGTARHGLVLYNTKAGTAESFTAPINSRFTRFITRIQPVSNDLILVGTAKGLFLFNTINKRFVPLETLGQLASKTQNANISAIAVDGHIWWIGTQSEGLFQFNHKTGALNHHLFDPLGRNNRQRVFDLALEDNGNLWVATSNGLNLFDPELEQVQQFLSDASNPFSLSENQIISLFIDRTGVLWAGGYNRGINKLDLHTRQFEFLVNNKELKNCVGNVNSSVIIDESGQRWVGADNGLFRYSYRDSSCKHYQSPLLADSTVTALENSANSDIWIGTRSGLNRLDPKTDKVKLIAVSKDEDETNAPLMINTLFDDQQGYLWIGTHYGLFKMNTEVESIEKIFTRRSPASALSSNQIFEITQSPDGYLWIATARGLNRIDPTNDQVVHFLHDPENPNTLSNNAVYGILVAENNLWLATANGLNHFDRRTNRFIHYGKSQGLNVRSIYALEKDSNNNMWLSSNQGLVRFNIGQQSFHHFGLKDGIQALEFTGESTYDQINNKIYFSASHGLVAFNPDSVHLNQSQTNPVLTKLLINNRPVNVSANDEKTILANPINQTERLVLSHQQSSFALEFSAMHYASPDDNSFRYKIDGITNGWLSTSAFNRRVSFGKLAAGEYTFHLQATNHNGAGANKTKQLVIVVNPPWYLSPIAKFAYLLSIMGLTIFAYKYRTRVIRRRALVLEQQVRQRTQELSKEKRRVDLLLERKNQELVNMSHEFRTPLTLMLGPINRLKHQLTNPDINVSFDIIKRNCERMLKMVNQLLDIEQSRVERVRPKQPIPVTALAEQIIRSFQELAESKGIKISQGRWEVTSLWYVPDVFEKIFINLLSNAIKYTPEGGNVLIEVFSTDQNEVQLVVHDSGIGIEKSQQSAVFDRYYRASDPKVSQQVGAGIGLALVKELLTTHGGAIELQSEPGKGTKITITLERLNEHCIEHEETPQDAHIEEYIRQETETLLPITNTLQNQAHESPNSESIRETLLVVEDNADMRTYLETILSNHYHCLFAADGVQGIELAMGEIPDLIITDLMMPNKSGFDLCQQLKSDIRTSHIPIIILTARHETVSRIKGWQLKADEFISKPFNELELLARISNLLAIRQLLQTRRTANEPIKSSSPLEAKALNESEPEFHFLANLSSLLDSVYQDSDIKVIDIAKQLAMSERQLFRKMKALLNVTPADYLRTFRLEKSKQLLELGQPAGDVALAVGFSTHTYFSKCFKAKYGMSPSEYSTKILNHEHEEVE